MNNINNSNNNIIIIILILLISITLINEILIFVLLFE